MKFSQAVVAALGLCLTEASVLSREPTGTPITDPVRLAELKQRHSAVIGAFKAANGSDDLAERRVPMMFQALYPGFLLFSQLVSILDNANSIASTLFEGWNNEVIWESEDYCRTYFLSQGGGNCYLNVKLKDEGDASNTHDWGSGCSWIDPPNTDPPVGFFVDDGIGEYSLQYTATSEHAWRGIDGTRTCNSQGLCHPQYIFYRDDFELVLNTWQSEGTVADCQYFGTENCGGLCQLRTSNEGQSGGHNLDGNCAIPCADEGYLPPTRR